MEKVENKNESKRNIKRRLNIVALVLVIVIFTAGLIYSIYLNHELTKAVDQLDALSTENSLLESHLTEIEDELGVTKNNLVAANEEIGRLSEENEKYETYIEDDEAKWRQRYEEYPVATEVWIAMKAQGWSDIVCAGIMGNLMAETGGTGTLQMHWNSNGENGYGLIQWIGGRRTAIKNKYGTYPTVKEQVQFIHDELYGTNGVRVQVTESQRNAIMNAETPEECAYAFACYYERCHESVRSMRRGFARKAYEYFVV